MKSILILLFVLGIGEVGWGQASIGAIGTAVTQNFNTLTTAGTWTDNSTLLGWYAKTNATASITSFYKGTGSTITTAGLYSFSGTSANTDRALGYIPSDAFTGTSGVGNGYLGWRLKNNTGVSIGTIRIVWTGEQYRKAIDGNIQYIILSYQVNSTVTDLNGGTYIQTISQFASPIHDALAATSLDGNLAANRVASIAVDIDVVIPAGNEIMLRWEDLNDPANHILSIDDISFTATKQSQTITFNTLADKTYGDATFNLAATASSGLTVSYASSNLSVATISGNTVTITGAGTTSITASQVGNSTYSPATDVIRVLNVKPQKPTATAATSITPVDFIANWTSASGAAGYYLYYGTDPTLTTYTAASVGNVTTFDLTGLNPNTTYYYRLKSINTGIYSDYSGIISAKTGAGVQTYNITATPSFTGVTLNWSKGNLSSRVVFVKEGAGTMTGPEDGITYIASTDWNNVVDELGNGYFCVYHGTGTSVSLTNLYPGLSYTVQAYEYNGSSGNELYLTTVAGTDNPNTFTTWGSTTFTNTTPGQSTAENWNTAVRWDHAIVPTTGLHEAVEVYIDGNCAVTSTAVSNNLTIKTSHSNINPKLTINPGQSLTVVNTLTNSNGVSALVLKSDATGTGSLMHNTANVNATVERYISGSTNLYSKKYHLVSVPLNSTTYLSNVWLDSYLFTYIEGTNDWYIWDSPTDNVLQTKQGAMVFYPFGGGSKTYSITGQLNNGTYSPTVAYSGAGFGYNLVPNPYPSTIDWNAASGWTKTNITGTIWGFNSTLGNYGSWTGSAATNGMSRYIPVGQGFFVMANASSPVLTMNNSVRLINTTAFLKSGEIVPNVLNLTASGNDGQDEIAVQFADDATSGYDSKYDAAKFYGDKTVPQLSSYTADDASLLSISGLPAGQTSTIVPLHLDMDYKGDLTFTAKGIESFNETSIQLEDKQLAQMIDLNINPVYTFNHTPTDALDRFVLHFSSIQTGIVKPGVASLSKVTTSGHEIYLQYPSASSSNLMATVYDLQGRVINQFKLSGKGNDHISIRTFGAYLVKLNLSSGVETHKIVVL